MQEMCGRELFIIYLGKINFGSSIPIWKSSLGSILGLGRYFNAGWIGVLDKKHGCLILSFNREWDSLIIPKVSFIVIWKLTPLFKHILKWQSFNSEIKIKNLQGKFTNALSLSSDLML
jgi:hypothetical protein